jgi:hypothetical protein
MLHLHRTVLATLTASVAALVGCGDVSDPTNNEGDVNVTLDETGVETNAYSTTYNGCPVAGSAASTQIGGAAGAQQAATKATAYLLGGAAPSLPSNPGCNTALGRLRTIRDSISNGKYGVFASNSATVCGQQAGLLTLRQVNSVGNPVSVSTDAARTFSDAAEALEACYGNGSGVSGFFHPDSNGLEIDPEPANLTQPLTGSNGASAAAVYVNSGGPTSVVKWSPTFVQTANPPAAGTPCSTGNLDTNGQTLKLIQAGSGNFRKCI